MTLDGTPTQILSLRNTSLSRPTPRTQITERSVFNSVILLPHPYSLRFAKSFPHDPHAQHDVPPGLSERDTTVLRTVKRRANVLDKSFNLCGARFGWTFIIGTYPPLPPPSAPLYILPSAPRVGHPYEDSCFRLCCSNRTCHRRCVTSRVRLSPCRSPGQQGKVRFPCHPSSRPSSQLLYSLSHLTHVFPFPFLVTSARSLPSIIYAGSPRPSRDA